MTDKIIIDFGGHSGVPNSGALTVTSTSSNSAVPANTELLGITATAACHFRIGVGTQTALQTDPMASPGFQPLYVKLDTSATYNIAAVIDPNQTPNTTATLAFFRVMEG